MMKKKMMIALMIVLFGLLCVYSVLAAPSIKSKVVQAGSIEKSPDSKNLIMKDSAGKIVFNVTSSTPLHYVGDFLRTKEWGYEKAGTALIKGSKKLEIVDKDYICSAGTEEVEISKNDGIRVFSHHNPECTYWARQFANIPQGEDEPPLIVNVRNFTKIDDYTIRVDYADDLDPTYVNYTGSCDTTCYILAQNYNATLVEGSIDTLIWHHYEDFDWADDEKVNTNAIGAIYASGWQMNPTITTTSCTEKNLSGSVNIHCSESGGITSNNNWTFYPTYIKFRAKSSASYRFYNYFGQQNYNSDRAWDGDSDQGYINNNWQDWDSDEGIAAISHNARNTMIVVTWNETVKTDFDWVLDSAGGYDGLVIGRDNEISGNTWLEGFIKVLPKNGSTSGDAQYVDMMECFKADPTCNDTEAGDSPPAISNLRNTSTTNESTTIEWDTDKDANYTIKLFNDSARDSAHLVEQKDNDSFAISHNPSFSGLKNSTTYYLNLTACDSAGNCASDNSFSFATLANEEALSESEADNAIQAGIEASEAWPATVYDSYQLDGANSSDQFGGRFDKLVLKGSKRWAVNYVSSEESGINGLFNITPVLYVLQLQDMTSEQITNAVSTFINSTYT